MTSKANIKPYPDVNARNDSQDQETIHKIRNAPFFNALTTREKSLIDQALYHYSVSRQLDEWTEKDDLRILYRVIDVFNDVLDYYRCDPCALVFVDVSNAFDPTCPQCKQSAEKHLCGDCSQRIEYDRETATYKHLDDPAKACFLIPAVTAPESVCNDCKKAIRQNLKTGRWHHVENPDKICPALIDETPKDHELSNIEQGAQLAHDIDEYILKFGIQDFEKSLIDGLRLGNEDETRDLENRITKTGWKHQEITDLITYFSTNGLTAESLIEQVIDLIDAYAENILTQDLEDREKYKVDSLVSSAVMQLRDAKESMARAESLAWQTAHTIEQALEFFTENPASIQRDDPQFYLVKFFLESDNPFGVINDAGKQLLIDTANRVDAQIKNRIANQ